jgi:hypothetical protein
MGLLGTGVRDNAISPFANLNRDGGCRWWVDREVHVGIKHKMTSSSNLQPSNSSSQQLPTFF